MPLRIPQHRRRRLPRPKETVRNCESYKRVPLALIEDLLPLIEYRGEKGAKDDQFPYGQPNDEFIGAGHLIALIKDAIILHEDFSDQQDPIDPDCRNLDPPNSNTPNGERYDQYMLLLEDIYSRLGWQPAGWSDAAILNEARFKTHGDFLVEEFKTALLQHYPNKKDWITRQMKHGLIIHTAPHRSVCINELGNVLPKVLRRMLGDKDTVLAAIEDNFAQIYRFAQKHLQNDFDVQLAAGMKGSAEAAVNALQSMSGTTQQQIINYWYNTHIPKDIDVATKKRELEEQLESHEKKWAAEEKVALLP